MTITDAISSILHGRLNFCCLCLKAVDKLAVYMSDRVCVESEFEQTEEISEIINYIYGKEVISIISEFGIFCAQCSATLIQTYAFMKSSESNCKNLYGAVQSLTECVDNAIIEDSVEYNTLIVSLNTEEFTIQQHYDNNNYYTVSNLHQRLNSILKEIQPEENSQTIDIEYISSTFESDNEGRKKKAGYEYYNIPSLATSEIIANESSAKDYQCKVCQKKYLDEKSLRMHYFKKHYPKKFKCKKCPQSFVSADIVKLHDNERHNVGVCYECGKYFPSKAKLRQHELSHKLNIECQKCSRKYKSKMAFKKHIKDGICQQKSRKKSENGIHQCDICKKRYWHKPYLAKHIQHEHGDAVGYVCNFCNKKFYTPSRLQTHLVKHTHEKNYVCSICDGRFVTKSSLIYHTRLHTGETPYKCDYCEQAFLSASRRLDHMRRHHMPPMLECPICHIKFKSSCSLLKHKKRHSNPNSRLNTNRMFPPHDKVLVIADV